jgi:2-polyprenyl-6-methoxyphenol hydroxylase-like FAD-dependent oxidoreductase
MIRVGWHHPAKLLIYPIRNNVDAEGRQLVNWVVYIETPEYEKNDWNRPGKLEVFIHAMEDWHFDWLDVPHFIRKADAIYEYPMVDQDPLPCWSFGRLTLLGDAAHPMYPVGSNGASQAILDARCIADRLCDADNPYHALHAYEQERLPPTTQIVLMNRKGGPEGVIDAVEERAPEGFTNIDDVLPYEHRKAIVRGYASTAGFAREQVNKAGRAA